MQVFQDALSAATAHNADTAADLFFGVEHRMFLPVCELHLVLADLNIIAVIRRVSQSRRSEVQDWQWHSDSPTGP